MSTQTEEQGANLAADDTAEGLPKFPGCRRRKGRQPKTLAEFVRVYGLTLQEIADEADVSVELIEVLMDGGQTMPSLALRIARAIDLPPAALPALGHVFHRSANCQFDEINHNPQWYAGYAAEWQQRAVERKKAYRDWYNHNIKNRLR